jgi:hypothetical protein
MCTHWCQCTPSPCEDSSVFSPTFAEWPFGTLCRVSVHSFSGQTWSEGLFPIHCCHRTKVTLKRLCALNVLLVRAENLLCCTCRSMQVTVRLYIGTVASPALRVSTVHTSIHPSQSYLLRKIEKMIRSCWSWVNQYQVTLRGVPSLLL